MKKLEKILESIKVLNEVENISDEINGVHIDSRTCDAGSLFIAYKGTALDSHNYITSAVSNGASYIILDDESYLDKEDACYILVDDSQLIISTVASNYYGHPSREMTVIGVTGTNGKTTTANLLYKLLFRLGHNCGLISTIEVLYNEEVIPSQLTTPDAISLQRLFRQMLDAGVHYVCMEVSSHAIDQGRVDDVDFDHAIFTNLTHDHLDYHKDFMAYLKAKKLLFDRLSKVKTALVNTDDHNGLVMVQNSKAEVFTYALKRPASYKGKILSNGLSGLQMTINHKEVYLRMVGGFNAYNALAVYGTGVILGIDEQDVLTCLSTLTTADGRLDMVSKPNIPYRAVIDYAHTPDALDNVIETLVTTKDKQVRLITVVGCGGDRDRTKRPMMARLAAQKSDVVILTSDNPRSEDPMTIIEEMLSGVPQDILKKVSVEQDRSEAIRMACALALPGDIILIAGKGHEKYQEIKGERFPFDDKKIVLAHMS